MRNKKDTKIFYKEWLDSACVKKKKKKIERRDWYAVSGRRSQYKIDTEKLVETPEENELLVFFTQYLLGKPFFTPWGR